MELKVINSGSIGNGYVLENENEILLIEAGVKAKEMLQAIDYKVGKVVGCIATHIHSDHSKYIADYMRYGIKAFAGNHVANDIEDSLGEKVVGMKRMARHQIGGFTVIPFKVPHDETECDGFLILHEDLGSLLFITDAEYCRFDFSKWNINHVMVECNYSMDYVKHDNANLEHILKGHMELETCKRLISSLSSHSLRSIGLLHLSYGNANSMRFTGEVERLVDRDVKVYVAEKGFTTDLMLEPF